MGQRRLETDRVDTYFQNLLIKRIILCIISLGCLYMTVQISWKEEVIPGSATLDHAYQPSHQEVHTSRRHTRSHYHPSRNQDV